MRSHRCECGKELSKTKYTRCAVCVAKAAASAARHGAQSDAKNLSAREAAKVNENNNEILLSLAEILQKIPWLVEGLSPEAKMDMASAWRDKTYRAKVMSKALSIYDSSWERSCKSVQEKLIWQASKFRATVEGKMQELGKTTSSEKLDSFGLSDAFFNYGFLKNEIFRAIQNKEERLYVASYCSKYHQIVIDLREDFWDCNPKRWIENDKNPISLIQAEKVWKQNEERVAWLKAKGYKVFILWESDVLSPTFSIEKFLTETVNLISNVKDVFRGKTKEEILSELGKTKNKVSVLFEHWQGDYNFSTGIRNSNAFNVEKVFFISDKKKWDKRGAMGAQVYCDIQHVANYEELLELKKHYTFIGVDCVKGSQPMEDFVWPENTLMIFGEEGFGISSKTLALCDKIVHITQFGSVRSMNVGTASGIAMYDFCKKNS